MLVTIGELWIDCLLDMEYRDPMRTTDLILVPDPKFVDCSTGKRDPIFTDEKMDQPLPVRTLDLTEIMLP